LRGEHLIDASDDCSREDRLIDDPEFEEKSVEPFCCFTVCLQSLFGLFSVEIVTDAMADSFDACAVVCGCDCQNDGDPCKSSSETTEDPTNKATKEYDAGIVPPRTKVVVVQASRQPILMELIRVLIDSPDFAPTGS
jgi:hypothetical protein